LLVKYFHNNALTTFITIFTIGLVVWLTTYFSNAEISASQSKIMLLINNIFSLPLINGLLAFLLICTTALFINIICEKEEIVNDKQNQMPGLLYVLAMFSMAVNSRLNEVLFINLSLLFALSILWSVYRKEDQFAHLFNLSFLFGLIPLFYYSSAIYLICLVICIVIIKPLRIKETFIAIIGFITPLYFKQSILFILFKNNKAILSLTDFDHFQAFSFSNLKLSDVGVHAFIFFCLLVILTLVLFLNYQNGIKVKTLKARNTLLCLLIFDFIFGGILFPNFAIMVSLAILPLCILAGDLISSVKNIKYANIILLAIFINGFLYLLHQFGFLIYN
jgi:hypothetical protein